MLSNPATMACKSHSLYRLIRFSGKPRSLFNSTSSIAVNPLHKSRHFPGFHHSISLISSPNGGVKELGYCSRISIPKLGSDIFRVSAVSNGGGSAGGSAGGGSGGSGGGNSGDSGAGGGKNWSLLSWYLSLLEKYPVLTKAVTSALLTLVGDVICQVVIDKAPSVDWKRTFLFTSLGLVLVGPTLHYWYLYLSKLVTVSGSSGALARLLLDQCLFSPIFIGVFLSTLVTLEGRPHQVIPKLQQEWFSAVLANWQLWIPFQFLNFRFVPQQFQLRAMIGFGKRNPFYQTSRSTMTPEVVYYGPLLYTWPETVLAANFIALIWNVILSYKAHKEVVVK